MKVTIERKKFHEGIFSGKEWKEVYEGDHLVALAKKEIKIIVEKFEEWLELIELDLEDDRAKVNDVYAVTELLEGDYVFDVGDFIYYISIEK